MPNRKAGLTASLSNFGWVKANWLLVWKSLQSQCMSPSNVAVLSAIGVLSGWHGPWCGQRLRAPAPGIQLGEPQARVRGGALCRPAHGRRLTGYMCCGIRWMRGAVAREGVFGGLLLAGKRAEDRWMMRLVLKGKVVEACVWRSSGCCVVWRWMCFLDTARGQAC